jgi:tetratricopeptide (TPR) repeat protein
MKKVKGSGLFRYLKTLGALLLILTALGCSRYVIFLDKPDYHYQNGYKFLTEGNLDGARVEFEYAVFLDDQYAPAFVGLAMVHGYMGDMDKALEYMEKAQIIFSSPPKKNP